MSESAWYVVQSHACKESFVRQRIEDLKQEVFLPFVAERVPGSRRWRSVPLFPSYMFARLSRRELPRVRWSPGVRRVLGDGERPQPVADAVVACIRERTDRGGRLRSGTSLRAGVRVRIVGGPLAGLAGVMERPARSGEQRIAVLLDVFHRTTRVEVAANDVWDEAGG